MDDNWYSQLCLVTGEVTAKESPGTSQVGAGREGRRKGWWREGDEVFHGNRD